MPLGGTPVGAPGPRGAHERSLVERILRRAHLDPQRRAGELEVLAKAPFEVALVGVGDVLERVAVDHDDRRVHAALVRVAQLRPEGAGALRRLVLDRLLQQPRQHRRRHLARRRRMGLGDRLPDRRSPWRLIAEMCSSGAKFRNARRCSIERCSSLLLVVVDRVPLVDRQHHRTAVLEDVAGDVRVLVGHALRRVEQQQHDVGVGDRLQRLDDRELLDRLEDLAAAAQAGGVDQLELSGRRARTAP